MRMTIFAILVALCLFWLFGCEQTTSVDLSEDSPDSSDDDAGNDDDATDDDAVDDDDASDDDDTDPDDDDDDDDDCSPLYPDVKVVAHRGASVIAPENTLPAIEAAFEMGAFAVEADIRHTSDGYFVLMHDSEVDRTTDGSGLVSDMTLDEILQLTVNDTLYGSAYPDLRVPTFEEALELIDSYDGQLYLDMKTDQVEGAIQVVVDMGLEEIVFVYSGSMSELERVRVVSPEVRIMPSAANIVGVQQIFDQFDPDPKIVDVHDLAFTPGAIDLIHSHGALVAMDALGVFDAFGVLGAVFGWRLMMDWGLDIIQTDFPEVLIEYRDSLCE